MQNSYSRVIVAKFQAANDNIQSCCLSLDDRLLAVAASSTIYIWNITSSNPHLVKTFIGHTKSITSLAFSSPSTLISASKDKSVKFWQIGASSVDLVVNDPEATPVTLPLISSIGLQARNGIAVSSDVDGVIKAWDIPASLCKTSKSPAKENRCGDTELISTRLVFVWYVDEEINIWDPEKGRFLLQVDVSEYDLLDLRISGDGSKIFCINRRFIQVWDMWTGEAVGKAELEGYYRVESLTMDGSRVWIETEGWDFGLPGSPPVKLSTLPPDRFYLNDTKLWDNNQCRIQDVVTGNVVFQLPEGFQGHVIEVQWNGKYLAVSLRYKELILEFHPTFIQ